MNTAKYLTSNSWTIERQDTGKPRWIKKEISQYSYKESIAVEIQQELDCYATGKPYYFIRKNRYGYGYDLCKRLKWNGGNIFLFNHADEKRLGKVKEGFADETYQVGLFTCDKVYPFILIFKEKHGDRHFRAADLQEYLKVCLFIVRERIEEEWYHTIDAEDVVVPELSKAQLTSMKDGVIKRAGLEAWDIYERESLELKDNEIIKKLIKKVESNDGWAAAEILDNNANGEYEGFEQVELEIVK